MSKEGLFNGFSEVSAKAWKQKIQFDLKGADYNEALLWESSGGIKVRPFYNNDDLKKNIFKPPFPKTPWKVGEVIYAGNATMANVKALDTLQRGAESLVFMISSEDIRIEQLLQGIDIATVPIHFDFKFLSLSFIKKIIAYGTGKRNNFHFNMDIIGNLARTGNWFHNLKKDHEIVANLLKISPEGHMLGVDVSLYQNAGAHTIQQLAYAMAHVNEYLGHFELCSSQPITFKVSIGSNYFFEIAKLKALRLLWSTLALEYGLENRCHILAYPTKRNKTLYDYNVNMLRTTTECMAAVLGEADTICNTPYDAIYHKKNEFGDRIARNQLLILKEESYFDKVANPADGSFYIESITAQMAEKALELFKSLEKSGGFLNQLKNHTVQKKIKDSAQKEQGKFNAGQEILVGTNKHQNPNDRMKDDVELYPFVKTNTRKTLIEPIIEKRLAESLEQKRLKNE
ncbi:MAG: methylmalonyl-CoA mutase subunit beta [Bacteroidota bacterium]